MESVEAAAVDKQNPIRQLATIVGARCHHTRRVQSKRQGVAIGHVHIGFECVFDHVHHFEQNRRRHGIFDITVDGLANGFTPHQKLGLGERIPRPKALQKQVGNGSGVPNKRGLLTLS